MAGEMSWVGKKIHLYNVTMGLYMLDWWERCLFSNPSILRVSSNLLREVSHPVFLSMYLDFTFLCHWDVLPLTRVDILVLILLWFVCFNGSRFASDVFESHLKARIFQGSNYGLAIGTPSS
ncbi:hypothetical protein ZEAMMB73_Zm00001d019550 [Zea mays]|uniref:Uncharacterized protein n=2 Tax=Zea mays TaxID=4577 RepID=A0A1D6HYE4_MAIZE|nr:hypothetical protein ZEAMMB73_Zm00001d019550 [Zea mays]